MIVAEKTAISSLICCSYLLFLFAVLVRAYFTLFTVSLDSSSISIFNFLYGLVSYGDSFAWFGLFAKHSLELCVVCCVLI